MQEENDLDENAGGHNAPIEGRITFENVTFAYNKARVLDRISFNVKPGQTVAIVGQTGSGKSTLTQLINRTYDTLYGRVLVDGIDVRQWDLTSLRSQISKIEEDIFALICGQANPAAMARLKIKRENACRPFLRPEPSTAMNRSTMRRHVST